MDDLRVPPFQETSILKFLEMGDPQVTMGFNTTIYYNLQCSDDFDDLGVPPHFRKPPYRTGKLRWNNVEH